MTKDAGIAATMGPKTNKKENCTIINCKNPTFLLGYSNSQYIKGGKNLPTKHFLCWYVQVYHKNYYHYSIEEQMQ